MSDFGTHLRSAREARGLSRPQLRDAVRDRFGDAFSTSTLENWENGRAYPPSDHLARMIIVLDAPWDAMFSALVADARPAGDLDPDARPVAPVPRRARGSRDVRRPPRSGQGSGRR